MKRKKKLLVSLFMSVMLVMGLVPAVAAAETTEPVPDSFGFRVVSMVQQGGTAAPGEADFRFILSDKDGNTPADYGVTMQDIKIRTNGEGDFYQDVTAAIDPEKVTTENGWTKTLTSDPGDGGYACGFVLSEKNDGAEGWKYSEKEYNLRIRYDKNTRQATATIYLTGQDVSVRTADFTNIYAAHKSAGFAFRIVKTVEQGGATAPGKATFRFMLSDKDGKTLADYGIKMPDNTITTNGTGNFYKDLEGTIDFTKVTSENGWVKTLANDPGDGGYYCSFVLKEKNDGEEGWKYSEKEYTVRVRCDKNQGTAMVAIWIPGTDVEEVPAFTNTFTKDAAAAKTDKNSPKTGDDSNIGLWAVMLLVSGGVITGAIVANRRKHSAR